MTRTLAAALVLAAACSSTPRAAVRAPPLAGKPVEVAADDLAGRPVRLAPDGRVRVIDFWATWCEPCQDQLPFLDALETRLRARGLAVAAVAFDEDREMVEAFLAKHPVSIAVLWDKGGARLAEPLEIQRLPTTLLLDRRGVVRHVHVGYDAALGAQLEREVTALLDEPPPAR